MKGFDVNLLKGWSEAITAFRSYEFKDKGSVKRFANFVSHGFLRQLCRQF